MRTEGGGGREDLGGDGNGERYSNVSMLVRVRRRISARIEANEFAQNVELFDESCPLRLKRR